ncbi:hypothetical protein IW140_002577 [Coemansia sp. RSA 1813]|nr:hypothetical protein LPJ74_001249 [Coemansia sp. RSA 1843]KAJ2090674.1 hypothetical protein IW138_002488 [Coemansia sp. RSA 986]KAJ2216121.1 hypothetical protein EV179_001581 [Coemansia sp. RSA 487]KAJ2570107.1 hypothetical protein IW140_002577 [Coemansia sp. RSA 1813]
MLLHRLLFASSSVRPRISASRSAHYMASTFLVHAATKHVPAATLCTSRIRQYTSGPQVNLKEEIQKITDLAMTAKDEMDFAEESRNSVYYNDDKKAAHEAVEEMTSAYNGLLDRLSEKDKSSVDMSIGMKIKEIQTAYDIMTQSDLE